jgi:transposase
MYYIVCMPYQPTPIKLALHERATLESWVRSTTIEQRMSFRARIVLLADEGLGTNAIADQLGTRAATVSKWRCRFSQKRIAGLSDIARPGKRQTYTDKDRRRILDKLGEPPPKGYAQWNGRLLAEALELSADFVWTTLRNNGIQLQRRRSWCISTDPQFAAKAADIVGLYLNPPENCLVISVDEKPAIQALERAQGYLKLPNGKAVTGFNHEYKRHGTTTLFAALNVATGQVQTGHYKRRRRIEFLDFMNEVVKAHPDKELHVVLDNLNTHKPKRDMWLARHKKVHFHYTPTHASWLNQIEVWFSILTIGALRNGSFTSPQQVREAIDQFAEVYNQGAHPFQWTKEVVYQKKLKPYYA